MSWWYLFNLALAYVTGSILIAHFVRRFSDALADIDEINNSKPRDSGEDRP